MQIENKYLRAGLLLSVLLLVKGLEVQKVREFWVTGEMLTLRTGQVISTIAFPHPTSCQLEFILPWTSELPFTLSLSLALLQQL